MHAPQSLCIGHHNRWCRCQLLYMSSRHRRQQFLVHPFSSGVNDSGLEILHCDGGNQHALCNVIGLWAS